MDDDDVTVSVVIVCNSPVVAGVVDAVSSTSSVDVPAMIVMLPLVLSTLDGDVSLVSSTVAVIIDEDDVLVAVEIVLNVEPAVASVSIVSDTSVFVAKVPVDSVDAPEVSIKLVLVSTEPLVTVLNVSVEVLINVGK